MTLLELPTWTNLPIRDIALMAGGIVLMAFAQGAKSTLSMLFKWINAGIQRKIDEINGE